MKPRLKRIFFSISGFILLFIFLIFAPKEAYGVDAVCSQITIGCMRKGFFENFILYNNGYWNGKGLNNNIVYVDPNSQFDVTLYAGGGYGPYVYSLTVPGEATIEETRFAPYNLFNPSIATTGQYAAQVDYDSSKVFTIVFKIFGTRNSSSSERTLFASSPPTSTVLGETYIYSPALADSIVAGNPVIWHLSISPPGMQIDELRGKITWLPTEQQIGYHEASLLAAVDDGDKSITEEQNWTITVRDKPSDNTGGVCFILALDP